MSLRSLLADEHLIPSATRVAAWAIPKRVQDAESDFNMVLMNAGVRGGSAKAFNSGNVGIHIKAGMAGEFLYLDQPGVVGLEDQSEGFVAFGKYPLRDPRQGLVYKKHHAKGFGDTELTKTEWEDAWGEVQWVLEGALDEAGYSVKY